MQGRTRTRSNVRRKSKGQIDYTLLVIVAFMLAFGLIMVYSASSYNAHLQPGNSLYYLTKQAVSAGVGLVAMFIVI